MSNDVRTAVKLEAIDDQFSLSFRRDVEASYLIYRLNVSSNLLDWTTVLEIIGNADPAGIGFLSEKDIPGTTKHKLVTGRDSGNVSQALEAIRSAAGGIDNLLPPIIEAVKASVTLGEVSDILREAWGTYDV